jgi:hypothetical protein
LVHTFASSTGRSRAIVWPRSAPRVELGTSVARICRDERVFRRARAVEAPPACETARRLVQTRSGLLAGASLRDRADVRVGADIDGVVVAWALHRLWPIKWACNLCRKEVVTYFSELSQDTSRLAAAAFSQTPCVCTVHLLPHDVSLDRLLSAAQLQQGRGGGLRRRSDAWAGARCPSFILLPHGVNAFCAVRMKPEQRVRSVAKYLVRLSDDCSIWNVPYDHDIL